VPLRSFLAAYVTLCLQYYERFLQLFPSHEDVKKWVLLILADEVVNIHQKILHNMSICDLESIGFLFCDKVALDSVRLWLPHFILFDILVHSPEPKIIPARVIGHVGAQYRWDDFEVLDGYLTAAFMQYNVGRRVPLRCFFRNDGLYAQSAVRDLEIDIPNLPSFAVEEESNWCVHDTKSAVPFMSSIALLGDRTIPQDYMGAVVRCAKNNPTIDSRQTLRLANGGLLKILKQFKYSEPGTGEVSCPEVRRWRDEAFSQWNPNFGSPMYRLLFVFITNRRVTGDIQRLVDTCADLVVVDDSVIRNYLPRSLAHLVAFIDNSRVFWVQCDTCKQWRMIPLDYSQEQAQAIRSLSTWTCADAPPSWSVFSCIPKTHKRARG